jgi:nucleotide-binding universal stress UspA family protein
MINPPSRILVATDLSARSDRAIDRAAQLAGAWQAELIALNVFEPTAAPDQAMAWAGGAGDDSLLTIARRQLGRDLADIGMPVEQHVIRAPDAAEGIRDTADAAEVGLVVTGTARDGIFGRLLLGSTVTRLARLLRQPLLVVRRRGRSAYRRVLVTTDFSAPSRLALDVAAQLFADCEIIVFHARDTPDALLENASAGVAVELPEWGEFLAGSGLEEAARVVERGPVEVSLAHFVRAADIDLVVLGATGRGGVARMLLGSTAAKLLDWLPCDTLLVR